MWDVSKLSWARLTASYILALAFDGEPWEWFVRLLAESGLTMFGSMFWQKKSHLKIERLHNLRNVKWLPSFLCSLPLKSSWMSYFLRSCSMTWWLHVCLGIYASKFKIIRPPNNRSNEIWIGFQFGSSKSHDLGSLQFCGPSEAMGMSSFGVIALAVEMLVLSKTSDLDYVRNGTKSVV